MNEQVMEILQRIKQIEPIEKIKKSNIAKNIINSKIYNKLNTATERFSKGQKLSAAGTAGVLALAAVLSVAPVADLAGTSEAVNTQREEVQYTEADTCYLISIGGSLVLAVATEEDAKAVFEGVRTYYLTDKTNQESTVTFDREFRWDSYNYKEQGGEKAWTMTVDEAVSYIIKGSAEPKEYVVKGGDTIWDIAKLNNMSISELETMNPGITGSKLKIGSTVKLYESKPFVGITTTETIASTEVIPFETVYEDSETLYKGQTKVKTAGVEGTKNIVASVTKVNGVAVSTNVISEEILSEPQKQIALKGTASYSSYVATTGTSSGILAAPMSHMEISSGWGASRGSRRHAGIDLRNPKGTPFGASAAGTVISAKYSGSYGNIIKVDHGGGLHTYYAHCDSMYVQAGDTVEKGQTLGTVGSTGNATGNVLHFEVRVNGVAQNPANYL